jgi:hypothetical protein
VNGIRANVTEVEYNPKDADSPVRMTLDKQVWFSGKPYSVDNAPKDNTECWMAYRGRNGIVVT